MFELTTWTAAFTRRTVSSITEHVCGPLAPPSLNVALARPPAPSADAAGLTSGSATDGGTFVTCRVAIRLPLRSPSSASIIVTVKVLPIA